MKCEAEVSAVSELFSRSPSGRDQLTELLRETELNWESSVLICELSCEYKTEYSKYLF